MRTYAFGTIREAEERVTTGGKKMCSFKLDEGRDDPTPLVCFGHCATLAMQLDGQEAICEVKVKGRTWNDKTYVDAMASRVYPADVDRVALRDGGSDVPAFGADPVLSTPVGGGGSSGDVDGIPF